eukprot:TRINITY_DN2710_c0_g1_i1.p1 TRINITY_DN2710_c0_g1~~TRINITY_DN2710_c0_g1_i1.p1  ORF type:complete len:388 (-),score=63.57 TRINITY_DN2710_c0_g1_i1:53-1216(-)
MVEEVPLIGQESLIPLPIQPNPPEHQDFPELQPVIPEALNLIPANLVPLPLAPEDSEEEKILLPPLMADSRELIRNNEEPEEEKVPVLAEVSDVVRHREDAKDYERRNKEPIMIPVLVESGPVKRKSSKELLVSESVNSEVLGQNKEEHDASEPLVAIDTPFFPTLTEEDLIIPILESTYNPIGNEEFDAKIQEEEKEIHDQRQEFSAEQVIIKNDAENNEDSKAYSSIDQSKQNKFELDEQEHDRNPDEIVQYEEDIIKEKNELPDLQNNVELVADVQVEQQDRNQATGEEIKNEVLSMECDFRVNENDEKQIRIEGDVQDGLVDHYANEIEEEKLMKIEAPGEKAEQAELSLQINNGLHPIHQEDDKRLEEANSCLLYTSPSPRD